MESAIQTTVTYKTEIVSGKEVQVEITKQIGLQTLMLEGKPTLVEAVTYKKYPGKNNIQKNFAPAAPPKSPEETAAQLARLNELYANLFVS